AGYDVRAQEIIRKDRQGNELPVYSGAIFVKEVGVDIDTHQQNATIAWNGRGNISGELTIPYAALSDTRAFSATVGAAGAAVHPHNIRDVQTLLVEFVQQNIGEIPRQAHAERLGLFHGGLVLPAGAIGFKEPVRYIGQPAISVGASANAYPAII